MSIIITLPTVRNIDARRQQIKDILARGNVAVFTSGALIKKVSEFKEDADGDIEAFYSNGRTKYVCWSCSLYEISEEPKP